MNKFFLALAVLLSAVFASFDTFALTTGGEAPTLICCPNTSVYSPFLTGPCRAVLCSSYLSLTEASMGDDYPVIRGRAANGSGIEFSLHYSSYMADGEKAVLSTVMGFGWSHTYNIYLFEQNGDLFNQSPTGLTARYKRYGTRGNYQYKPTRGHQQTVVKNGTSFDIFNNDALHLHFDKIPGNPVRIQGVEPWMLTRITDRNGNETILSYTGGLLTQVKSQNMGRTGVRRITLQYNANKRLSKIIDPIGRQTVLSYDSRDNLTGILDPVLPGQKVSYDYNALHQIVGKTDKNGRAWQYRYDSSRHPVAVIDPDGKPLLSLTNDHNWQTDNNQLVLNTDRVYIPATSTKTDGNGNKWRYDYDRDGLITFINTPPDPAHGDADGSNTRYEYDPATLNLSKETDDNGHVTRYIYDAHGNLTKKIDNNNNTIKYDYYPATDFPLLSGHLHDRLKQITYPNNSVTVYTYDGHGNRLTETRDQGGLNLTRTWTYESDGSAKTETDANSHPIGYTYDDFGNLATVTDALDNVTRYIYTKPGFPDYPALSLGTKVIDGNGHETAYLYDDLDRLIRETDPLGFVTNTFYDPVGNRMAVQRQVTLAPNPDWQLTIYVYDSRYRQTRETKDPSGDPRNTHTSPLNLVTSNTYDGNNNRMTVTDPRLKITSMEYDFQNRLSKVTDAQQPVHGVTEYRYDGVGNRTCVIDANGHDTFYEYDGLNRLTIESRKMGAQSCTTGIGDLDDLVTQTAYDTGDTISAANCKNPQCAGPIPGSNSPASRIDPENKYSYFKYDHINRGVMTIRKQGATDDSFDSDDWSEITQYDGAGNVLARTDANGNVRGYSYYDNNWLHTDTIDPGTPPAHLNETTTYTYDNAGNIKTVQSPGNNLTTNNYNNRNELIQVSDMEGPVAGSDPVTKPGYVYDGVGNRIVACDGNDHCSQFAFDAVNRMIAMTDALSVTTGYAYDKAGNLLKTTDRENNVTCYLYDDINRRTFSTQLVGGGNNCALLDANDVWTKTHYDLVGNVKSLTTAKHGSTPDQCTGGTPPEDCETTLYAYDEVDRLLQETYPKHDKPGEGPTKNSREFEYDKAGNLIERTDQKNQVTQYQYNDLYYMILRDYLSATDPDDSFEYDVGGRMTTALRDGWEVTFEYDDANRVKRSLQDGREVKYDYNIPTRTRTLTYPNLRQITESQDLRNRLERVDRGAGPAFPITPLAFYQYDWGNRVETRRYENGTEATYQYNDNNWITDLIHTKAGSNLIAGFNHQYDNEGNKRFEEKQHDPSQSEAYQYDDLNRLIHYKVGELDVNGDVLIPLTQTRYELDKLGNWDKKITDGNSQVREHNAVNEITKIDADDITSDDNGNLMLDNHYSYEYDFENRLTKLSYDDGGVSKIAGEYRYDALSRRIVKKSGPARGNKETHYFYDDARIIEEQSDLGVTGATYVYGNYIDEVLTMNRDTGGTPDFETYYYHQNALWSVEAITDSLANVVERYAYDAYGHPTITNALGNVLTNAWGTAHSAIGNPWMFTGRQLDEETGLYFYRARYYDNDKGRFLQRDALGYVIGMNLYEYVLSSPTTFVDPAGFATWVVESAGTLTNKILQGLTRDKVGKIEYFVELTAAAKQALDKIGRVIISAPIDTKRCRFYSPEPGKTGNVYDYCSCCKFTDLTEVEAHIVGLSALSGEAQAALIQGAISGDMEVKVMDKTYIKRCCIDSMVNNKKEHCLDEELAVALIYTVKIGGTFYVGEKKAPFNLGGGAGLTWSTPAAYCISCTSGYNVLQAQTKIENNNYNCPKDEKFKEPVCPGEDEKDPGQKEDDPGK